MRILVTGAAGKVGSLVVQTLADAGHDVVATDIQYRRGLPVQLQLVDLCDAKAVYPLVEGCDAVLHMGNHPNPWSARPKHRILTENTAMNTHVFTAARDLDVKRLVFVSSVQVCAKIPQSSVWSAAPQPCVFPYLPLDSDLPPQPGMNMYALSKMFAEQYLQTLAAEEPGMSLVVARLPYVHTGEIKIKRGYFHPLSPDDHRLLEALAYIPGQDACTALHACLEKPGPGYHQYFIARTAAVQGLSTSELAATYLPHIPVKNSLDDVGELIDLSKLRDELGWSPSVPQVELPRAD